MALFGALFSGITALSAQGTSLSTISDNISNVRTVGYKATTTQFSTFVTAPSGRYSYAAGGVRAIATKFIDRQGLLEASPSTTDLGVSGKGFFVVKTTNIPDKGEFRYTRAGSFLPDKDGNLINKAGYYLLGWETNGDGEPLAGDTTSNEQLRLINVSNLISAAVATTRFSVGANLPSETLAGRSHTIPVRLYDSFGGMHNLPLRFTRLANAIDPLGRVTQNAWDTKAVPPAGASIAELKEKNGNSFSAVGRLDFQDIPDDGDVVKIGDLAFEFDSGDGVAPGHIAINRSGITSPENAVNALVKAYHTTLGKFAGPANVARANQLNSLGGRFAALPPVTLAAPPNGLSETAFNILQAAFKPGANQTLSFNLKTEGGVARLAGKTDVAFGVNGAAPGPNAFGSDSPDISGLAPGDTVEVYVRDATQANGRARVAVITIPPGGVEVGSDGQTTLEALEIGNMDYTAGGYPALPVNSTKTAALTTGEFHGATRASVQANNVSAAANNALRALANFDSGTDTLSLNLETTRPGGNAPVRVNIEGVASLAFQLFDPDGNAVGARTNFGADSDNLAPLAAGSTIAVFVNDGSGNAIRVSTITLGGVMTPGASNGDMTDDALTISGFTYDGTAQGFTGTPVVNIKGVAGGRFDADPDVDGVPSGIPESVRAALTGSGRLSQEGVLSLNLLSAGGALKLKAIPNMSFLVREAGEAPAGGTDLFDQDSPDLTSLDAGDEIDIFVDSNGGAPGGQPVRVATINLQGAMIRGTNGEETQNALTIGGFNDYQLGGFAAAPVLAASGVTESPGGDFLPATSVQFPQAGVAREAVKILESLGSTLFNGVERTLTLSLQTVADPSGGADRQTRIAAIPRLAFVLNPGGNSDIGPQGGDVPGAFGEPSVDLTQGITANDTIDIYADTEITPTLIARIALGGALSDDGTQAGETTPNALRIDGFTYVTDERVRAGTGGNKEAVLIEQAVGEDLIRIDASGAESVMQKSPFVVRTIVPPSTASVIFGSGGVPEFFNLDTVVVDWANGAAQSNISIDLGSVGGSGAEGLTQYVDDFSVGYVRQNGVPTGVVSGIDIDEGGLIRALFDNGLNRPVFQLPLALFPGPNALYRDKGNAFAPTAQSGLPLLNMPAVGAAGRIAQSTLEASTADIAQEFSKMIVAQRAFSAASRVVTTADEMLDELVRIKR